MDLEAYREEVKFALTGGLLELEIDDQQIDKIINYSFKEVQRYIDIVKLKTVPYKNVINLKDIGIKANAVSKIFRAEAFTTNTGTGISFIDPMQAAQWQLLSGTGNMYYFQDYVMNYASWNTLLQIRNTSSTDLAFYYDRTEDNLYINISTGLPNHITIAYIPRFDDISEIISDYWIDILTRLSIARAKIAVGTIRTRFTQTNALWVQNGQQMLDSGTAELAELRQQLKDDTQLCYPSD